MTSGREQADPSSKKPQAWQLPDPMEQPVVTAEEAFRVLGIDRSTGYKAIREGTFPVPVLRIGRVIRVPTLPLVQLLRPEVEPETDSATT